MDIESLPIQGLKVITLDVYADARGFFIERFHASKFARAGITEPFVQDNHSRSKPHVLRGLHYQHDAPQGKLVGVICGAIWDVAVDIRPASATFGRYFGIELSEANGKLLWIPAGFAHGFCVMGEKPADVFYKCTAEYNPQGEGSIRYDDPELGIHWPVDNPLISERDACADSFHKYKATMLNK